MKIKTTNALMKYMRNKHHISIGTTKDKRNLINIGYYHGYKGYRFISNPNNRIEISNFNEIVSIVDFDSKLKSLLYPQIMQIETISKNIVLQLLIEEYKTDELNEIYEKGMTDYRDFKGEEYKKRLKHRLNVQNNIYSSLSKNYSNNNKIVCHFYSKDKHVPIWAIFEIITLGVFSDLIKSLRITTRKNIDKALKINIAFDTNAKFPEKIMYLIKSLRNSIAHNDVIFDVRFRDGEIDKTLCRYLENELKISDVNFNTLVDYVLLISFLLKNYGIEKKRIIKFIRDYENIIEDVRNKIPINIYTRVVHTNTKLKLLALKKFINQK